jgi:2-polyprenyl-3-methyl-5-hydroxy-6-metoxy-1,4-benzoquinol methylase
LLRCAGFSDIQVRVEDECHLVAEATKIVRRGERQVAPSADGIRPDHRARYEFACQYVPDSGRVLDIACGVGYGAWILATGTPATEIIGVDRDQGALEYAKQNFANPKVHFREVDALDVEFPSAAFDAIVSFETVEHLPQAAAFLQRLHGFLRPGGVLVCSTPNEVRMPFQISRFPYHHRHFTPEEFRSLLNAQGFTVYGEFSQEDAATPEVSPGWAGSYLIAVCGKAPGDE